MKHLALIFIIFFCNNSAFSQPIDNESIAEEEYFEQTRGTQVFLHRKDSTICRGIGNFTSVFAPKISGIKRKIQNGRTVIYKDDFYYMLNGISVSKDTYDKIVNLVGKNEVEIYIELIYSDTITRGCISKLCFATELKMAIFIDKQEYRSDPLVSNYGQTTLKDEQIISIRRIKRLFQKDFIEILLK